MNEEKFIEIVFSSIKDKGVRAAFRRADSSRLNYQCVEFLLKLGIDADNFDQRTAAFTVMASIARSNTSENGAVSFARGLALSFPDKSESDAAILRMRKLCSCENVRELAVNLRPILDLISSRNIRVDYASIYRDMLLFRYENQRDNLRIKWMKDFYSQEL